LRQLNRQYPKNRLVLNLLKECYLDSHAWQDLAELMPQLEKHKVVDKNEALHLERTAYGHLLSKAAHASDDSRALDTAWSEVPHGLRRDKELLTIYIRYLLELGETSRPESILRHKIKTKWDDGLVHLYGLVTCDNPAEQLKQAERWLKKHQENATLLLTLGRLSLRNHMWAKARTYLEKSAEIDPRPETYMLLGKLLEQTGDAAIAGECFRKGLGISVSHDLLLERTPIEPASEEKQALAPVPPPAAPAAALAGSTA
jgi:HemY protein